MCLTFGKSVLNACNYQVFGVQLSGRNFLKTGVSKDFRFGYQNSEEDDEIKGDGNSYTTDYRFLDPRLGRWLSIDPVRDPSSSPYTSMDNNPILLTDVLGLYTELGSRMRAKRAEKNGYTATVVENGNGKHGVAYSKRNESNTGTYFLTQFNGKFKGIMGGGGGFIDDREYATENLSEEENKSLSIQKVGWGQLELYNKYACKGDAVDPNLNMRLKQDPKNPMFSSNPMFLMPGAQLNRLKQGYNNYQNQQANLPMYQRNSAQGGASPCDGFWQSFIGAGIFSIEGEAAESSLTYALRVRARGLQDPVSHNFPYSFDNVILSAKPVLKNNGYRMFQKQGVMNGKNGVFEIGMTKDGVIDHRFFRPY